MFTGTPPHARLSPLSSAFLSALLRPDPQRRSTAAAALAHEWLDAPHEALYSEAHLKDAVAQGAPRALLHALHARLSRAHIDCTLERAESIL